MARESLEIAGGGIATVVIGAAASQACGIACCLAHPGPIFHVVSYAMVCGLSAMRGDNQGDFERRSGWMTPGSAAGRA